MERNHSSDRYDEQVPRPLLNSATSQPLFTSIRDNQQPKVARDSHKSRRNMTPAR
jgi:hypothetical protein